MRDQSNFTDVIGVGIGPFNLSMAALLSQLNSINAVFFDRRESFVWHKGLLLPDAEIQVNYLQDLVTLVAPTNPYSFIAYLAKHKRLYRFIYANFNMVLREEFNMYLKWVSESLPNLYFDEKVEDIQHYNSKFIVHTSKRKMTAKHLVLGSGLSPYVPDISKQYLGLNVLHGEYFLNYARDWHGKRVAVIGGGQSAAEIIRYLLNKSERLPDELTWVTKRSSFLPLDESPFVNELFSPSYSDYFYHLPSEQRAELLQQQVLASDGISDHLLEEIYQRLYKLEFLEKRKPFVNFFINHRLTNMRKSNDHHELILMSNAGDISIINADIVILCTGYQWEFPDYLALLKERIQFENNRFKVNEDYSIAWDGAEQNRIYVQNAAKHTHGIADPNLCLMAWRSAKIINSIVGNQIFDIDNESTTINWNAYACHSRENLRNAINV